MNIKKLFGKNKSLVNSCLVYLACFRKLFQTVNSIILGPTGREETAWARTIGLNRGLLPGTQAPQCTTHWAIQQCKSHPSKTALSSQHINTSLSENDSQTVRVKVKIHRSTKQVTLVCCIFNFNQLHCFVFYESLNIQFN